MDDAQWVVMHVHTHAMSYRGTAGFGQRGELRSDVLGQIRGACEGAGWGAGVIYAQSGFHRPSASGHRATVSDGALWYAAGAMQDVAQAT